MKPHFFGKKGYTLVELTVVVAIIAILAVAGMNLISSDKIVLQEAENLSLDVIRILRDARTKALSGATIETTFGEETDEEIPAGGYGVFFDGDVNKAYVFADTNADGKFRDGVGAEDEVISSTGAYFPLLRLIAYRINTTGGGSEGKVISDSEGDSKDFWIIFAPNTGEITFGSETAEDITPDTKELFIDIIYEDVRHYHIFLNKVSRFLYLEYMSAHSAHE